MAKHGFYSYDGDLLKKTTKERRIAKLEYEIKAISMSLKRLQEKKTPQKFYFLTTVTIDGVFKNITNEGYEYPKREYLERVAKHHSANTNAVVHIIATTKMTHEEYEQYCKPE